MTPYTPPPLAPIDVVYRDEALLIVNKPSGLLSVPGRGPEKADCLIARVQVDEASALIVHRLDMETSGLLILALSDGVQRAMSMLFERRGLAKTYIALVAGTPKADSGRIDLPLAKDWPNRPLQCVCLERGKRSQTDWQVIERGDGFAQVKLTPQTGRTHQLRVHMEAIGHPILGDIRFWSAAQASQAFFSSANLAEQ